MAVTDTNLQQELERIGRNARAASDALRAMTRASKDAALREVAKRLRAAKAELQAENAKDLDAGREKGLSSHMLDRLRFWRPVVDFFDERHLFAPHPVSSARGAAPKSSGK